MLNLKRFLAIALCVVVAAMGFAACAEQDDPLCLDTLTIGASLDQVSSRLGDASRKVTDTSYEWKFPLPSGNTVVLSAYFNLDGQESLSTVYWEAYDTDAALELAPIAVEACTARYGAPQAYGDASELSDELTGMYLYEEATSDSVDLALGWVVDEGHNLLLVQMHSGDRSQTTLYFVRDGYFAEYLELYNAAMNQ